MLPSECPPRGLRALTLAGALLAGALLAVLPSPGEAQARPELADGDTSVLRPGLRVRLWAPSASHGRLDGFVEAVDGDVLVVAPRRGATLARVPLAAVERLQVQHRRGVRKRGARIGALVGTAAGAAVGILGALSVEDCTGSFCFDDLERAMWIGTGAAAGSLVGAGIGAAAAGDGWRVVETGRLRAGLGPAGLGVRLSARVVP